jgi:mono/diheme cytochrome c family protein
MTAGPKPQVEKNEYVSYGSYGSEVDWNDSNRVLSLDYNQDQGKRIFYQQCVWCHSDTTPAGPSNRSNVSPDPPLMNDGNILNKESDAALRKVIVLGGSAVGKSAMMPPYGANLSDEEIDDLIAYMRVIAVPEYKSAGKQNTASRN